MQFLSDKKLIMLKPQEIHHSKFTARIFFDDYEMQKLADSIATNGIIEPVNIRKRADGKYEIITGARRLKAARMVGLRRIPCILQKADDITAAFYSVIENLQRSELNFFEEAQIIHNLIEQFDLTRTETAVKLGIAQSTLSNKLRILQLSKDIQEQIISAHLTERHARALLRITPDERQNVLFKIIAEGLNIKQSEAFIEEILHPPLKEQEKEPIRKMSIGDIRIFANSLFKLVDTMQNAGITAKTQKNETEKYIEYKVRISKASLQSGYQQLKIC